MRPRLAGAVAVVAALLLAGVARAEDNPHLTRARQELDQLRYDRAAAALEQALKAGTSGPAELAEIYRLSGEVAAALGDARAAEEHFRRLLALSPDARLAAGISPKISEPFESAREFISAKGPLRVAHRVDADARTATLVVESDPARMVAGARADWRAGTAEDTVQALGEGDFTLALPAAGRVTFVLAAIDEYGNRLVEIGSWSEPLVVEPPSAGGGNGGGGITDPPLGPRGRHRPFYARWYLWGGLATGVAIAGTWFGLQALDAQDDLDALNDDSTNHDFTEALEVEDRGRRNARYANISFGVAGGLAVVAAVLAVRDLVGGEAPAPRGSALVPAPVPGGATVTFVTAF